MGQHQHNHVGICEDDSAESELLRKIKETIEKVNTSEAALIGVDKLIEYFETATQFGLEDITFVEQNIKQQNMDLEIGFFLLPRVTDQAYKVLKGQSNTETDTAGLFLELAKENATEDAAQANVTKEIVGETTTKNIAVRMAEYLAKLEEANSGENSGYSQENRGILAEIKRYLATLDKKHNEKIAAERKKHKWDAFYSEEDNSNKGVSVNV